MKFCYPEILSTVRNIAENIDNQSAGYNKNMYIIIYTYVHI